MTSARSSCHTSTVVTDYLSLYFAEVTLLSQQYNCDKTVEDTYTGGSCQLRVRAGKICLVFLSVARGYSYYRLWFDIFNDRFAVLGQERRYKEFGVLAEVLNEYRDSLGIDSFERV